MRVILSMLVAAAIAVATWAVPVSWAQTTFPGPVATVTSLTGTAGQQIIAANPTRRSIRICNTGPTNPVWIWPSAAGTLVSDYLLAPVTSNVLACYTPPNGVVGGAGALWSAKPSGGTSTVSVEEW